MGDLGGGQNNLSDCARKYRGFCKKYKPKPKPESSYHWGNKLLPKVLSARERKKRVPGQMSLPFWDEWEASNEEIREVAEMFVIANCYNPKVAAQLFNNSGKVPAKCQVSETEKVPKTKLDKILTKPICC